MLIQEGSRLRLYDGNDLDNPVIDEIIANQDIKIEEDGRGYSILLRTEGYDTNSLFESNKIVQVSKNEYIIQGYFKDALLIVRKNKYNPAMFDSYMDL